jgi:heme/copper-type cytochrome/quinol oxidase subunit 4
MHDKIAGENMASTETHNTSGIGRDIAVYVILLILAGLQFVIAFQNITPAQMLTRMLAVAIIEGALALLFFMHLSDNRGLMLFVVIFTVAVLLGLQYSWTDSYRLIDGVPWAR